MIEVISGKLINIKGKTICLELQPEGMLLNHSFHIKIKENKHSFTKVIIMNAYKSAFAKGWYDYRPFVSEDGVHWKRVQSSDYDGKIFSFPISITDRHIAWYCPNSEDDFLNFINTNGLTSQLNFTDKEKLPYLVLGHNSTKTWVLFARQHSGETLGSFFLQGFIKKLLIDQKDFLEHCRFIIFPLVNLAGVRAFNHRLSIDSCDLNRSWNNPLRRDLNDIKKVLELVDNDFTLLDVHGDEVTKQSYVYYSNNVKNNFTYYKNIIEEKYFLYLPQQSYLRRLLKSIIRKRKIIWPSHHETALNYFSGKGHTVFTIELSAHQLMPEDCIRLGNCLASNIVSVYVSKVCHEC